ncbi:shikimate kinase [Bradyrhizobium sp. 2TAF24]|uniref:shikimate kinase n=1 Tax=Bradyrhizobium sp. 2TAF24 TaxID=3233011 RepID=UPI003F8F9DAF
MIEAASQQSVSSGREAAIVAALGARSIVLVGMMGVGKSTVGRRLAARLQLPFTDADHEIEVAHAGMTIPEIFADHGEPYFRDGEARVIARLLEGAPGVLATGGGAFMREDTRARIRARAVSVWLRADADVILRRVKRRADRPLLQTEDPGATIRRLIDARYPVYAQADLTVLSRDEPHDKIAGECVDVLYHHLCHDGAETPQLSEIR